MKRYFGVAILVTLLLLLAIGLLFYTGRQMPRGLTDVPKPILSITGTKALPLNHPLAVAAASDGKRIYVSDSGNNVVQVFNAKGEFLSVLGNSRIALNEPYGVAVLPDGSVLVSDMINHRILQFNANGQFDKVFLPPEAGIKPGMLTTSKNKIYVADLQGQQVVELDLQGKIIRSLQGDMYFPQGIGVEGDGTFITADAGNKVLRVFDASGKNIKVLTGTEDGSNPFSILRGLAIDRLHRILAVDSGASLVRFMTEDGKTLFTIGGQGTAQTKFKFPAGCSIDQSGRIYIADWGNNRVQVWGY